MFKRYWVAGIATLVIVALLTIAALTAPQRPSTQIYGPGEQLQADYNFEGRYHPKEGFSFVSSRQSKSYDAASESERNTNGGDHKALNVTEADLLAQERVAHWTLWIGVFTAAGLIALIFAFDETRQATLATRDIGTAQVRAYISVSEFEIDGNPTRFFINSHTGDKRSRLLVSLRARNDGQTPARKVRIVGDIVAKPIANNSEVSIHLRHYDQEFFDVMAGDSITLRQLGGPMRLSADEATNIASGDMQIHVEIDIWYEDVIAKIERRTPVHFLCRWDRKDGWVTTSKLENSEHT